MNTTFKNKHFYTFKKYFMYLVFYSVGGFLLERLLNVIFMGEWFDNSVLIGPYQPLYGSGVLLIILFYNQVYLKMTKVKPIIKETILIIIAIIFTGIVEAVTGYGFYHIYRYGLWDYRDFFPCEFRYVCIYPTSLFGITSYLVVKYIHPEIKRSLERINNLLFYLIFTIFIVDIVISFILLSIAR